ncbi:gas vesicle protein GvpJ [Microtetraspora glauca]|uniref:gas vesicle protein GvpJ n=1 Tax=Microtetraspora glauca TaxID=1996 RepID=UPI003F4D554E
MTIATQASGGGGIERPSATGLADVIDTILDKGLVIDAYVRVSLVGIEVLTIDARAVIASVDTYLRFADAVNRLDIAGQQEGLPELVHDAKQGAITDKAKGVAQGALEAAGEKLHDLVSGETVERSDAPRRR